MKLLCNMQKLLNGTRAFDFLGPLALRLYLAPILFMAGYNKFLHFDDTAQWFGNTEWGLGLPYPEAMTFLATSTELVGAILLVIGLAVRWITIPLMITMIVAAVTTHWQNGWSAIADNTFWLFSTERTQGAAERLAKAKDILQEHGNYEWLTETGNFVVSNNGIEFAATYFIMLLVLFFIGGGKYFSLDYWLERKCGHG
ncbi:MAG: DoxX family protein [Gammaproteobacteria bacterium]|nr:DoxX family protein [Gammaproteobacteria bacterium]